MAIKVVNKKRPSNYVISCVKAYFINRGYSVDIPPREGVEADFRIKMGQNKRDRVFIIDVIDEFTDIKISQITNEKRFIFHVGQKYYLTTGRTLEKYLDGRIISIDRIRKFKKMKLGKI